MNSPNKMFGGMAGAMAGVLGGATSLGVQDPQTGTMTGVLGGNTNLVGGFGSTGASGTTGGVLSNATAGLMNTGQTPSATGTTSGALASAMPNAGMLSGVDAQIGGDVESRITALEQGATAQPLVKQNQITPSPINPSILGGFDAQKLTGVPNPTKSFNNTMPQGSALAKKKCNKKY